MTIQKTLLLLLGAALSLPGAEQISQTLPMRSGVARLLAGDPVADSAATEVVQPGTLAGQVGALAVPIRPMPPQTTGVLNIFVLVGNGAVNSIPSKVATTPVVEVRNDRNMPVEGAEVVLELPSSGPSGFFSGRKLSWVGTTDTNGQVVATGLTPNQERGAFGIRVAAQYRGNAGQAIITQTNSPKTFPMVSTEVRRKKLWMKVAIVAAAGGGAAAGIILATRGSNPSTVVLQPGTISIGGPR